MIGLVGAGALRWAGGSEHAVAIPDIASMTCHRAKRAGMTSTSSPTTRAFPTAPALARLARKEATSLPGMIVTGGHDRDMQLAHAG